MMTTIPLFIIIIFCYVHFEMHMWTLSLKGVEVTES